MPRVEPWPWEAARFPRMPDKLGSNKRVQLQLPGVKRARTHARSHALSLSHSASLSLSLSLSLSSLSLSLFLSLSLSLSFFDSHSQPQSRSHSHPHPHSHGTLPGHQVIVHKAGRKDEASVTLGSLGTLIGADVMPLDSDGSQPVEVAVSAAALAANATQQAVSGHVRQRGRRRLHCSPLCRWPTNCPRRHWAASSEPCRRRRTPPALHSRRGGQS